MSLAAAPRGVLWYTLLSKRLQLWRVLTTFLYIGSFKGDPFGMLFKLIFLFQYGMAVERDAFRGRAADFLTMALFFVAGILGAAVPFPGLMGYTYAAEALNMALIYIWSRSNPDVTGAATTKLRQTTPDSGSRRVLAPPLTALHAAEPRSPSAFSSDLAVTFYGLLPVKAFYVPLAMLGLNIIFAGSISYEYLVGIGVAHAYWYLTSLYPLAQGRPSLLPTPRWVRSLAQWMGIDEAPRAAPAARPGQRAFQGRPRRTNA